MSVIIRILGAIVGLTFVVVFGAMIYEGRDGLLSTISGFILGLIFLIYGIGGNKALSKILPGLAKTNWRGKRQ